MITGTLTKVIWLALTCAVLVAAAGVTGLRQQSEVKLTAQMAGAPFEGDTPASVWAMSFSPNGQYLAFGVQFVRTNDSVFPSYLLVVSPSKPSVVLKKFEIPRQPAMTNVSRIVWSADSRFLALTPYGDWDRAAVVDLDADHLYVVPDRLGVPWCGGASGVLPGPLLVQLCSFAGGAGSVIRFLGIKGTVRLSWTFSGVVSLLDISRDGKMLALDFWGPAANTSIRQRHEVAIVNISDRTELQRWSLPEAASYIGSFTESGKVFCTEPALESVRSKHELVCRNISTGTETLRRVLPLGVGGVRIIGGRIVQQHSRIILLPFPLFGTDYLVTRTDGEMRDLETGKEVASWRIDEQKVLPKEDAASVAAVSPDAELVAIGGAGVVRVFHVSP